MPRKAATIGFQRPKTTARQIVPDRRKTAERGYGAAWQRFAETFLRIHPLCVHCEEKGRVVPATEVDHVIPHRGDMVKFWKGPFQSLCKACHSRKTARGE